MVVTLFGGVACDNGICTNVGGVDCDVDRLESSWWLIELLTVNMLIAEIFGVSGIIQRPRWRGA